MVAGLIDDIALKVGDRPVRLSGIKRIELRPRPSVLLADGKTVEGEVSGLGQMEVALGEEKVKVDLRKAVQIHVQPAAPTAVVSATVIASVGGKEVGRVETLISVRS